MLNIEWNDYILGSFSSTVVGSPMTFGTFTISTNPGFPVQVRATCTGWVLDTTGGGAIDNVQWLEASLDGGATWAAVAPGQVDTTNSTVAKYRGTWSVQVLIHGTPTGDIKVRVRASQAGGSVGMKQWWDVYLITELTGAI
jgi:hypothetical protein